jgi:hypothetical protein
MRGAIVRALLRLHDTVLKHRGFIYRFLGQLQGLYRRVIYKLDMKIPETVPEGNNFSL